MELLLVPTWLLNLCKRYGNVDFVCTTYAYENNNNNMNDQAMVNVDGHFLSAMIIEHFILRLPISKSNNVRSWMYCFLIRI